MSMSEYLSREIYIYIYIYISMRGIPELLDIDGKVIRVIKAIYVYVYINLGIPSNNPSDNPLITLLIAL